jgi:hypothetical protein
MGNPFLFADRFSGAVVHLTADASIEYVFTAESVKQKMPATAALAQAFP